MVKNDAVTQRLYKRLGSLALDIVKGYAGIISCPFSFLNSHSIIYGHDTTNSFGSNLVNAVKENASLRMAVRKRT
jgi:hypothetical protein